MTTIVSTEEAAALMIGLDYIPPGISLLGMTAAFLEEAEVELHNAKIDKVDWRQKTFLERRVDACQHRHVLAGIYLEALELELGKGNQSILVPKTEGSVASRIDVYNLAYWASNLFGISLPSMQPASTHQHDSGTGENDRSKLSKSMASTFTTFSLLLEMLLEYAPPKFKNNDKAVDSQIAGHIESLGKKYNQTMVWEGQSSEAIRKRLKAIATYHPAELLKK